MWCVFDVWLETCGLKLVSGVFVCRLSMYHRSIPTFCIHVLMMSTNIPMSMMSIICCIVSLFAMMSARSTAMIVVIVVIIPVFMELYILSLSVPSFLLSVLVLSSMSVSTLYPMSMRNAAIPAVVNFLSCEIEYCECYDDV